MKSILLAALLATGAPIYSKADTYQYWYVATFTQTGVDPGSCTDKINGIAPSDFTQVMLEKGNSVVMVPDSDPEHQVDMLIVAYHKEAEYQFFDSLSGCQHAVLNKGVQQ